MIRYKLVNEWYNSILAEDEYCIKYSNVPGTVIVSDPKTYGIMTFKTIKDLMYFYDSGMVNDFLRFNKYRILEIKALTPQKKIKYWNTGFTARGISNFYLDLKNKNEIIKGYFSTENKWNTYCYEKIEIIKEIPWYETYRKQRKEDKI